jgi:thiol-disulfide isomerase/thioredoxin
MKIKLMLLAVILMVSGILPAQTTPEPADKIMADAFKTAAKEKKNVMIVFHASWCGWCKKFDASVNDPACKDYFDKSFVIKHLTIMEAADKKNLENPGAIEVYNNNGGKEAGGIPYFLIYDKKGKLLADSKMKPSNAAPDAKSVNIGCPATDEEVTAFIEILKKTSKITDKEAAPIIERFKKNKS